MNLYRKRGTINPMNISLQNYYPSKLQIVECIETEEKITLKLKSCSHNCICPKCGAITSQCRGTYNRRVQDLPILGKNVELLINAREYQCTNPECAVISLAESFNGFLNFYSRMTERLADFICTLALETSCEGCSRVCRAMGIKISGDSIIRLLLKRYESQPKKICGSVVGIDDFAFKKRHTYGTIIVDEKTHTPIALLDGRDSQTLKMWLKQNQHVKAITRDRAGAYASAINEALPSAMQIADRFHLHQNLLETIQNVLQGNIPANIKIPKSNEIVEDTETNYLMQAEENSKK